MKGKLIVALQPRSAAAVWCFMLCVLVGLGGCGCDCACRVAGLPCGLSVQFLPHALVSWRP